MRSMKVHSNLQKISVIKGIRSQREKQKNPLCCHQLDDATGEVSTSQIKFRLENIYICDLYQPTSQEQEKQQDSTTQSTPRNPSADTDITEAEDSSKSQKYKLLFHGRENIKKIPISRRQVLNIIATIISFAKTDMSLVKCQISHTHFRGSLMQLFSLYVLMNNVFLGECNVCLSHGLQ